MCRRNTVPSSALTPTHKLVGVILFAENSIYKHFVINGLVKIKIF